MNLGPRIALPPATEAIAVQHLEDLQAHADH